MNRKRKVVEILKHILYVLYKQHVLDDRSFSNQSAFCIDINFITLFMKL